MLDLIAALVPHLLPLLGALLTLAITAAAAALRSWTGIEIEARHREALHRAIMSGLSAALARKPAATSESVIDEALAHAQHSVPGALRALRPDPGTLRRIAAARLAELQR
jgi:hypothetical protein